MYDPVEFEHKYGWIKLAGNLPMVCSLEVFVQECFVFQGVGIYLFVFVSCLLICLFVSDCICFHLNMTVFLYYVHRALRVFT